MAPSSLLFWGAYHQSRLICGQTSIKECKTINVAICNSAIKRSRIRAGGKRPWSSGQKMDTDSNVSIGIQHTDRSVVLCRVYSEHASNTWLKPTLSSRMQNSRLFVDIVVKYYQTILIYSPICSSGLSGTVHPFEQFFKRLNCLISKQVINYQRNGPELLATTPRHLFDEIHEMWSAYHWHFSCSNSVRIIVLSDAAKTKLMIKCVQIFKVLRHLTDPRSNKEDYTYRALRWLAYVLNEEAVFSWWWEW